MAQKLTFSRWQGVSAKGQKQTSAYRRRGVCSSRESGRGPHGVEKSAAAPCRRSGRGDDDGSVAALYRRNNDIDKVRAPSIVVFLQKFRITILEQFETRTYKALVPV